MFKSKAISRARQIECTGDIRTAHDNLLRKWEGKNAFSATLLLL
jgi:hypothetical protein